jgi:hypothetical protein
LVSKFSFIVVRSFTIRGKSKTLFRLSGTGKALLTLLVDDLEGHVAELGERGLATGVIDTVPGLYRKAVITDPEGNMISLGEDLSTDA